MGPALRRISAEVRAEPKVGGSLFRINRDIRFSSDKRPYKDHLDFWFWERERKRATSGFFLRLQPERIIIGVGAHGFDKNSLERYRESVVNGGHELVAAQRAVERAGYSVHGEHYKRIPRGYDASPEAKRFLLHNALWAGHEEPLPDVVHSADFVDYCRTHWKNLAPLHRWLVDKTQN